MAIQPPKPFRAAKQPPFRLHLLSRMQGVNEARNSTAVEPAVSLTLNTEHAYQQQNHCLSQSASSHPTLLVSILL